MFTGTQYGDINYEVEDSNSNHFYPYEMDPVLREFSQYIDSFFYRTHSMGTTVSSSNSFTRMGLISSP
jgi:hypothetical protein